MYISYKHVFYKKECKYGRLNVKNQLNSGFYLGNSIRKKNNIIRKQKYLFICNNNIIIYFHKKKEIITIS